jgi:hypothetical protein
MLARRSPRAPLRSHAIAARIGLVSTLIASAIVQGCGGDRGRPAPDAGPASAARPDAPTIAARARADSLAAIARADSARRADSLAAIPRFLRYAITGPPAWWVLRDSIGAPGWRALLRINRVDSVHVRRGDTLIAPRWLADTLATGDSLAFSPFPRAIEALADSEKVLLISLRVQAVAAYARGRLVHWAPASTGRRDKPTPPGLYHTNWKARERVSTIDEAWLLRWYVNLHNLDGISLHQYELPGHPASHSCVRLLEEDAMWFHGWIEQWRLTPDGLTVTREGTPAVVFGEWTWGARAPWKRLPEDPGACTLDPDELADALRILHTRARPDIVATAEAPADTSHR